MLSILQRRCSEFFSLYFIDVLQMQKIILAKVDKHVLLLLRIELAYHLLDYLSGESLVKDSVVEFKNSSGDISDKEKSIAFYLVFFLHSRDYACNLSSTEKISMKSLELNENKKCTSFRTEIGTKLPNFGPNC